MKPRTAIAIQFSLWAFFFSRIIPFSGDFILPIIWIYDRRVFAIYLVVNLIDVARYLPGSIALFRLERFKDIPSWEMTWMLPLALVMIAGSTLLTAWMGAWWLKRMLRKKAPDILERL